MAHPSRPTSLRRRKFRRLRQLGSNLYEFFAAQGARLAASATARTVTYDNTTELVTSVAHGFVTGKGPVRLANSGGAVPTGLSLTTLYWPIRVDDDTFRLALSRKQAVAGTAVAFSTNGTGTNTILYSTSAEGLYERARQMGLNHRTIRAASDIDNL